MFFESYDFIWVPQRPPRTRAEIDATLSGLAPEKVESYFTFEDRVAVRSLLYSVIDDVNLRNVLDGLMLPPPYSLLDLSAKRWTAADIASTVRVIEPVLDGLIVQLPFNLAMRLGSYDARLRAACRRLCWVLNVPFAVVEAQEEAVAAMRAAMTADGSTSGDGGDGGGAQRAKQEDITARKEQRKYSAKRIATVGGFAVLGGAALVLTGGLVAPLVAPAFAALATATTVTLTAIGSIGTAILGSSVLAGIFSGIVGVATHAAALASVLTPVLTAANVTAVFGVSGATLAGYKAVRRTGDSDVFVIRSIDEVETFTGTATAAEEDAHATGDAIVTTLAASHQAVEEGGDDDGSGKGLLGTKLDLTNAVEDGSKPGLVVPSHTRTVAMANVANIHMIKKRNRHVVFAVQSALTGYELRLKAIKLISGVWGMAPAQTITAGNTAICASMNRYMHPTGTGFVLCYTAEPVQAKGGSAAFRLWTRVKYDLLGGWEVSSFCEGIERELDPFKAEMRLETNAEDKEYTKTQIGVTMEAHLQPFAYVKVYPASAKLEHSRKVTFPVEELPQRQLEYAHDVKRRRKIGVSFVNNSRHVMYVKDINIVNGAQWSQTASPMVVEPRNASLTFFTNTSWSLEGAEASYILEIDNTNDDPITPKYYVRLQFEVSALNNVNIAVATAPSAVELRQMELTAEAPDADAFTVATKAGLFFGLNVRLTSKDNVVHLVVDNAVERDASVKVVGKASLSIGVCGYSGVFDARRPMQDQQVGLWQPVLRSSTLLGASEAYALQWEDEYLTRFGESVKIDLQVADQVGQKAVSKAKSVAKKELLQGAIFSGFQAFNSFLGAFELPLYAVWASDVIDNNFATLSNRATFTGKDLATALLDTARGRRPTSLIGFSFGSKVIAECLHELERVEAVGVVENVYLLGATFPADREEWTRLRRIVAGRLVNVYTRSDWALWLMYKANEGDLKPMAGITPVNVAGVENVDASAIVQQHSGYALNLAEVLDLIPRCPTEETWSNKTVRGSPGVVVPTTAYKRTIKTMSASLKSVLSSTPYCAMALRNSVVTDIPDLATSLELVAVSMFNCFFDFVPPPSVEPGCAGVFGIIGEDSGLPMGGVFSFRMRLDPDFSARDVLLLVPFYAERNNDVSATVRPSLVTQRSTRDETDDDADSRFYTIATQAVTSLEDAKANTLDAAPAPTVLTPTATTAMVAFDVPLDGAFLDGHRNAAVRVCLSKTSGGVAINVLALLTRAASQLQQEKFSDDIYGKQFAKAAETAARISLGLGGDDSNDSGEAKGKAAGGASGAEVVSIDHFQSTLFGIAAAIPTADVSASSVGCPRDETYIVVANCGQVPLYFGEEVYGLAGLGDGAGGTAGKASVRASPTSAAGEEGAMPASTTTTASRPRSRRQQQLEQQRVQWTRFPPPELPPQSFCVVAVTRFDYGLFPRVRYETADGVCAFDIRASAPLGNTPSSSFAEALSPGPTAAPPSSTRLVLCSAVAPLEASATAHDGSAVGEVSTSTTDVRGVRFHLVLMTPKASGGGESVTGTSSDEPNVKKALKSYGWFIA